MMSDRIWMYHRHIAFRRPGMTDAELVEAVSAPMRDYYGGNFAAFIRAELHLLLPEDIH